MENYFRKYRPFLLFLAKFLLTYLFLIFLYQVYLGQFDAEKFESDGVTTIVAENTTSVLKAFGYDTYITPHESEPSYRLFVDKNSIVRIVEGCNAVSVMILFVAFVVAFSGKRNKTILFVLGGIVLIHVLNVLRIAFLIMGLIYYPEYGSMLHDIVFPLFIYGVVFGLWVVWINKFSSYAEKSAR